MAHEVTIVYARDTGTGAEAFDNIKVAKQIEAGLTRLGYDVHLHDIQPDGSLIPNFPAGHIVFNLIERVNGSDALAAESIAKIENMGVYLTGARASNFLATSNKAETKKLLAAYGVPVLPTYTEADLQANPTLEGPFIVKSATEHASVGLDEKSVVATAAEALERFALCRKKWGGEWFAEPYIDGREFNASLLQNGDDVDVLPMLELCFVDYPDGMPKIIDYGAKWDSTTFAYNHALGEFAAKTTDADLLARLQQVARNTWYAINCCGYARIDMRVDKQGNPWVLEINVDPSLEENDYFMSSAAEHGLPYEKALQRIIDEARNNDKLNRLQWRTSVTKADAKAIRALTKATGFFTEEEVRVSGVMVDELLRGQEKYHFLFAEDGGKLAGYVCYGATLLTECSYDLYWLAVHPDTQKNGLGKSLVNRTARHIRALGGGQIYAETSGTNQYASTRRFYEKTGFVEVARLANFYRKGDDKYIYCKQA